MAESEVGALPVGQRLPDREGLRVGLDQDDVLHKFSFSLARDVEPGRPGFDTPARRKVKPIMNEIREVIERKAALLETGDVKAIMSHYADKFVEYTLAPPLRQPGDGRDLAPLESWIT